MNSFFKFNQKTLQWLASTKKYIREIEHTNIRNKIFQIPPKLTIPDGFSIIGIQQMINQITGYDACERLKESVLEKDREYSTLKEKTNTSKSEYYKAIEERAKCQRELNTLLQRKHIWTEDDVNRFTELYKNEMRLEAVESQGKGTTERLEKQLDILHLDLMNGMRERYQQEQLWSDKIRKISSYGTVGLLMVNILLFLSIHFLIEPNKKAKFLSDLNALTDGQRKVDLDKILLFLDKKYLSDSKEVQGFSSISIPELKNSLLSPEWIATLKGIGTGFLLGICTFALIKK